MRTKSIQESFYEKLNFQSKGIIQNSKRAHSAWKIRNLKSLKVFFSKFLNPNDELELLKE